MGVAHVLERVPALASLDRDEFDRLTRATSFKTLHRGEALWQAGDGPGSLTVIKNGLIKLVRPTSKGRSVIWGIFGPPETIGDMALLRGVPYPSDAIAATETATLLMVPRDLVLSIARRNPELALSLACGSQRELVVLHHKIDVLSAGSVEARLATLLLKLYDQFGDDFEDGSSRIPVALSRRDLAELVATSFETAIRVMTRWERQGVVSTDDDGFTMLNLERLRATSGNTLLFAPAAE